MDGGVRARVLVVEDDEQVRHLIVAILEREGYQCTAAADAPGARLRIAQDGADVVLCDVGLPGESGLDLVEDLLSADERLSAVMVSGMRELDLAHRALEAGAYGYVLKPFTTDEIAIALIGALRHRRRRLDALAELKASREETVHRLCIAVESRDPGTGPHIEEMSEHCRRIAGHLGWDDASAELLGTASAMHDVGKIGVPDAILLKPGPLTAEERALMQLHAEIGHRILAGSRAELLQTAATVAWTHHERFDGTGYPRGLAGQEIPLEGRVAAVADVYDALSRDRVYRPRLPEDEVMSIIRAGIGTHFDPDVVEAFFEVL